MAYGTLIVYLLLLFIRPQEWVSWMMAWPIMNVVVGVAILATLLQLSAGAWRFRDCPENWLVLGFFIAVIMSNLADHFNKTAALNSFTVFGKVVLLYFLISVNLTTVKRVRGFMVALIIGCAFMTVHAILQIHTGSGFGGQPPLDMGPEGLRAQFMGFFEDPNDLALALVVALPCVVSGIHRVGASPVWRMVCIVLAGAMGYAIFLTNSRGGWLALVIMMMSYVLLNFHLKKFTVVVIILMMVALMALAPARVGSMSGKDESAHNRLVSWANGISMLKASPIFGVGKGRYTDYSDAHLVAHNSFVHCFAELGLFGYFWWIGIMFASIKDSYALGKRVPANDPEQEELARVSRILLAALIGYLASAVFLSRAYTPLLFILIGLIGAIRAVRERESGPVPKVFVKANWKRIVFIELASIPFFHVMIRFMWH